MDYHVRLWESACDNVLSCADYVVHMRFSKIACGFFISHVFLYLILNKNFIVRVRKKFNSTCDLRIANAENILNMREILSACEKYFPHVKNIFRMRKVT